MSGPCDPTINDKIHNYNLYRSIPGSRNRSQFLWYGSGVLIAGAVHHHYPSRTVVLSSWRRYNFPNSTVFQTFAVQIAREVDKTMIVLP